MKKLLIFSIFALPLILLSQNVLSTGDLQSENTIKTAKSPSNRVAVLELYTSEGCSSCPPADRFMSGLKKSGISSKQLIPMAFHVTYWDYIGWKDRFADKKYDQRQRDIAHKKSKKTIYTPQFVLVGDDYRSYSSFNKDIDKLVKQKATVDLVLSAETVTETQKIQLKLQSDISRSEAKDISLYFAVLENDLKSDVSDGENDGEKLHHDYVVRTLSGPYIQSKPEELDVTEKVITIDPEWKLKDLSIIAFAENPHTGEVLQAVKLKY